MSRIHLLRAAGKLPRPARTPFSSQIRSILFSYPYHRVGDFVLSITLLERIHARWPEAVIDVAVGNALGDLAEALPFVRNVYRIKASTKAKFTPMVLEEMRTAIEVYRREIASTAYDLAIAPRWDSSNSFLGDHLAYLTGAPVRCGYSGQVDGGSKAYDHFLTHVAQGGQFEHESQRHSRLLARCNLERESDVPVDLIGQRLPSLVQMVEQRRSAGVALPRPVPEAYVVLAPGAMQRERMWPLANFTALGRHLLQEQELRIVLLGGPGERELCETLRSSLGEHAVSLAGVTTPLQAVDVIAGAQLYIGNDSGLGHIAGALGIETLIVSPFPLSSQADDPRSPQRFRPLGPHVQVVQPRSPLAPCTVTCNSVEPHCILQVTPQEVIAAIPHSVAAA